MKNYFRPSRQQEAAPEVSTGLSPIEQASLRLLHSARVNKREELEHAAKTYAQHLEQESSAESLAGLLCTRARELKELVESTHATENSFYYSRRGKKEAIKLIADQHLQLNPHRSREQAFSFAIGRLYEIKQFNRIKQRRRGQTMIKLAIAPQLEMPAVCKVEGEFIGEDIYAEQSYKLQFVELALLVNYVVSDRHSPENNASTGIYRLSMPYQDVVDPVLTTYDGEAVTDKDHYFVLGLIQETADYFTARASLRRPPQQSS